MILFSVGKDRPGIADDISTVLYQGGANIEDSRMAVLGGCFSIMTLFACTPEQLEAIREGLQGLKRVGLDTFLHEATDPTTAQRQPGLPLRLEVTAMDHPGIVQKVVHLLRSHGVNIETLDTQVSRAPLSGAPLFNLSLEATVPVGTPIAKVKQELDSLGREMDLDLFFRNLA
jgi:glycine cleavage system transcriptional repressor